jgi:hypothetical protein
LRQQNKGQLRKQNTAPQNTEERSTVELKDIRERLHPDLRETFIPLDNRNPAFSAEDINAIFGENPRPLHDLVQLAHEKASAK